VLGVKMTENDVSFIMPARNNKKYFEWSYNSIRKNVGNEVKICAADDNSNDGTLELFKLFAKTDKNFSFIVNDSGERKGHIILYDQILDELVKTPIAIISHADMYWTKDSVVNMLKYMKSNTIVSATRIEPFLHPAGKEKVQFDMGLEPDEFKEIEIIEFVEHLKIDNKDKTTTGIFAPWMFWVNDFIAIGGHDPLFAPQSREDDDIWNRFILNGVDNFIQSWQSYVGHLTCRGSRRNPTLTKVTQDSPEWLAQNRKSERNYQRKWGTMPHHTDEHFPIIPHKYKIMFVIQNCNPQLLELLEPWADQLVVDLPTEDIESYIHKEQPNTLFDLSQRIHNNTQTIRFGDVRVEFDGSKLTESGYAVIRQLSEILDDQVIESATFEYDIFTIRVNRIKYYEDELIICDKI